MTEVNTVCQWFADHGTVCPTPLTPIGRPAGDLEILLLGGEEEGELGIVSSCLPSYWRRPDLTAQAFQPLPDRPGARLFLTGDLVRRLPGGDLLHLGRKDREIKIRGLRVDASAVEAALRSQPGIREAAVDRRGDGLLVAWVVSDGDPKLPDLRESLAANLPPEAVPSRLVVLDALPTLGPGKIDRARLPDPLAGRRELATPYVLPESSEEERVAGVFGEVLGIGAVGALDDFFTLGGTSLLSLDALLGLERALGRPVDAALFVAEPTPRGIARRLDEGRGVLAPLADGEGTPVFFIPGHGGGEGPDLLQLARIARRSRFAGPSWALRLLEDLPASPGALLDVWTAVVRERQPAGPWRLMAACAGGPLGLELARRLSGSGEVRLVLHDALFPTRARRLRRRLRRIREPWGDDLAVRVLHHLRTLANRRFRSALSYLRGRARSAVQGLQKRATPTIQRLVQRQDAYLRLAQSIRPGPWSGQALLIVTPNRRDQGLPRLWRRVLPGLAVRHTGEDAERDSAAMLREFFDGPHSSILPGLERSIEP